MCFSYLRFAKTKFSLCVMKGLSLTHESLTIMLTMTDELVPRLLKAQHCFVSHISQWNTNILHLKLDLKKTFL